MNRDLKKYRLVFMHGQKKGKKFMEIDRGNEASEKI
jgi:hypothetical protein